MIITGTHNHNSVNFDFYTEPVVVEDDCWIAARSIVLNGAVGIGSIIMQWFAFHNTEKQLKTLMNISKTEAIIAVVGYGYYPDSVKCINAQRKSVDETITTV